MPIPANIDALIDSYDVETDPVLLLLFNDIIESLFEQIQHYQLDGNEYGTKLSQHLTRTSMIAREFVEHGLGLSNRAARNVFDANLLQDLGKIHPDYDPDIWDLPHRPSEEERAKKRLHPARGVELLDRALADSPDELKNHPHIQVIKAIQLYHHERVDGTGAYGLTGDQMGQVMQAICIIDAFDGDMIHRPHQPAQRTPEQALERMKTNDKYIGAFDPNMLQHFIDFQLAVV